MRFARGVILLLFLPGKKVTKNLVTLKTRLCISVDHVLKAES